MKMLSQMDWLKALSDNIDRLAEHYLLYYAARADGRNFNAEVEHGRTQ
jgi:hypothetical protein